MIAGWFGGRWERCSIDRFVYRTDATPPRGMKQTPAAMQAIRGARSRVACRRLVTLATERKTDARSLGNLVAERDQQLGRRYARPPDALSALRQQRGMVNAMDTTSKDGLLVDILDAAVDLKSAAAQHSASTWLTIRPAR